MEQTERAIRKIKYTYPQLILTCLYSLSIILLPRLLFPLCAENLQSEIIAENIKVHPTNATVFNTPIVVYNNNVYFVTIQYPPKGVVPNGYNLQTIIYKASEAKNGWTLERTVIEDRTIDDQWHTQASIGVDPDGYIHVAYNMHNMPWQYMVSTIPEDISNFDFKGQSISLSEIRKVKIENRTNFPTLGESSIPGNQISYPAFFNDIFGNLYVTYRYKLKPARKWADRASAGGIARYNHEAKKWSSIGGPIEIISTDAILTSSSVSNIQHPFLFSENFDPYLIQLAFDSDNNMHTSWLWRIDGAGEDCTNPCYAKIDNDLNLPISFSDSTFYLDKTDRKYYAPSSLAVDQQASAWIILSPISESRELIYINNNKKEKTPNGSTKVLIDYQNNIWLFASGPQIFRKNVDDILGGYWQQVYEDTGATYIKPFFGIEDNSFILYMQSDLTHIKIIKVFHNTPSSPTYIEDIETIN